LVGLEYSVTDIRSKWPAIRDAYDWERCADVYRKRGWRYFMLGRTPSAEDLKATADELFRLAANEREHRLAESGRILVRIVNDEPVIACEAHDVEQLRRLRRNQS
jgi:hypothetical protein